MASSTISSTSSVRFQGADDVLTPPAPVRRFHDRSTAPSKGFVLIPDASRFAAFRHPDVFLDLLPTKVRPAVTGVNPGCPGADLDPGPSRLVRLLSGMRRNSGVA
ncbi:hypothetical protein [Streptomyces sp. KHY 26]|uniref:hypothetical protein n=1 Tax=Streptomyces sp. KHY 26 TaxID=3097359 RepID=UPI00376ECFB8